MSVSQSVSCGFGAAQEFLIFSFVFSFCFFFLYLHLPVVPEPLYHSSARTRRRTASPTMASRLLPPGGTAWPSLSRAMPVHCSASQRRAVWLNLYWMMVSTASIVGCLGVRDMPGGGFRVELRSEEEV